MLSDCNNRLQIMNPSDLHLSWIQIQLSFWKAHIRYSMQSAVSDAKVHKYTLNSY